MPSWIKLVCFFSTSSFTRFQFTAEIKQEIRNGTYQPDTPVTRAKVQAPPATLRWFYATDVPLSKPDRFKYEPVGKSKKFVPFTLRDSQRLEEAYQNQCRNHGESFCHQIDGLPPHIIPVNEDHLFQVDLLKKTLSPVYWDGAVYEVRRGLWFNSDGMPLDETTTDGLEQGYAELKPYLFRRSIEKREKEAREKERKKKGKKEEADKPVVKKARNEASYDGLGTRPDGNNFLEVLEHSKEEKDLFCLNNPQEQVVIYLDDTNAVLLPDSFQGSFQLKLLREISAPAMIGVERVTRGLSKQSEEKMEANKREKEAATENDLLSSFSQDIPNIGSFFGRDISEIFGKTAPETKSPQESEEQENSDLKEQMEKDFSSIRNNGQREISHLVFCVHGIGQVLGTKYELVDFTHSVNMMRKTIKSVYEQEPRFQLLGKDSGKKRKLEDPGDKNCRVQVLPIQWRHKVDFSTKLASAEVDSEGEPRLPSLTGITVDGVQSLRNVLGDVMLDILLYYEPYYMQQIITEVVSEMNAVYDQYLSRNPSFNGKVSIMGHSLGSAICFDILAQQPDGKMTDPASQLKFDVENFFAVGSPVGVFKLLKRCNISSRALQPMANNEAYAKGLVLSPKCNHLYNIYHPCDPVGYRMEPLIAPEFARYKAEPIRSALTPGVLTAHLKDVVSLGEDWTAKVAEKASSVWSFAAKSSTAEPLIDMLNSREEEKKEAKKEVKRGEVSGKALAKITKCNANGRVDYALPTGLFDISLVSALAAHVTYFEDADVAGFMLQELLKEKEVVVEKKVRLY
ncbi:hypothetical protein BABINDRAFT_160738 [Babjeviella inositovora NRRL Y-12698]|uniref:DDHD domain-containing protein n=1 Tax=Babjeviella inositovora NRRL Y-12698 TaxID=984486 RepID=A0A1E3QUN7_9ASCO|nr:uncharacterized protein BABINDRAFT_160738 [Babjeviella inositovora NRRL Y-12698]ODQ81399.1 hypothetical protein BABINDRAFT_160738 [Babjeviella inositovora NRRL Y-12698]